MTRCLSPWRRTTFRPLEDVYQEVDGILQSLWNDQTRTSGTSAFAPRVNIAETETQFEVSVDLPGVPADKVDVSVHEGQLIISGKREDVAEESGKTYHRVERRTGEFQRAITLPEDIDEQNITAEYVDGVLTVNLPKSEKPQPTRVEVKTHAKN